MTQDLRDAFDHPEVRAAATPPAGKRPADRISLRDHVVLADIGAFQSERGRKQRLRFNVVVEVRPAPAPLDDDVDRILSYDTITQAIEAELAAERLNLLESLAERIADRILAHPLAERCILRVEKLDRGPGALGVEILRARGEMPHAPAEGPDEAPRPLVVFLTDAAIAAPRLGRWLDALAASGAPAILCTGPAHRGAVQAGLAGPQRRIDLLAFEMNAWLLAARDPRCMVRASRTELDHAARGGLISVWAPSKIVLDTPGHPPVDPARPAALALWLAELVHARRFIVIGPLAEDLVAEGLAVERFGLGDDLE